MLDLSFGLPITIRDAALKMVAPGPTSEVNREFYAQENERAIEEGRGLEGYEKTDEKARDLLRKLARSEPYYKKQRRLEAEGEQKLLEGGDAEETHEPGPIRTKDVKEKSAYGPSAYGSSSGGRNSGLSNNGRPARPPARRPMAVSAPKPSDILPPNDKSITSLFVTGVEDDLPEHAIRTHFAQYGTLRSVVCSHRSHAAFLNYMSRESAEKAAEACQGRAVVQGVPLRVQWGRPKPLDNMDREARSENARSGRAVAAPESLAGSKRKAIAEAGGGADEDLDSLAKVEPPPGQGEVEYAAMAGE